MLLNHNLYFVHHVANVLFTMNGRQKQNNSYNVKLNYDLTLYEFLIVIRLI